MRTEVLAAGQAAACSLSTARAPLCHERLKDWSLLGQRHGVPGHACAARQAALGCARWRTLLAHVRIGPPCSARRLAASCSTDNANTGELAPEAGPPPQAWPSSGFVHTAAVPPLANVSISSSDCAQDGASGSESCTHALRAGQHMHWASGRLPPSQDKTRPAGGQLAALYAAQPQQLVHGSAPAPAACRCQAPLPMQSCRPWLRTADALRPADCCLTLSSDSAMFLERTMCGSHVYSWHSCAQRAAFTRLQGTPVLQRVASCWRPAQGAGQP